MWWILWGIALFTIIYTGTFGIFVAIFLGIVFAFTLIAGASKS